MTGSQTINIPIWRRFEEGAGIGAGNRKLRKRYIVRAESLCKDPKFQAAVEAARRTWNSEHPKFAVNPPYTPDSEDKLLGHLPLARAADDLWNQEKFEEWSALQPTVFEWFVLWQKLHDLAFPPDFFELPFTQGQAIGRRYIEAYVLRGPQAVKRQCDRYFPTLQEIYEGYARRIVANGFCLPLDADTTADDLRDFARYALPIVRASTNTNETITGRAIGSLAAADFNQKDIAFRLGLNVRTVRDWLQSWRRTFSA